MQERSGPSHRVPGRQPVPRAAICQCGQWSKTWSVTGFPRQQIERARTQVAESIELQKVAIERAKSVARIAIPGVLLGIALIVYLIVTYL